MQTRKPLLSVKAFCVTWFIVTLVIVGIFVAKVNEGNTNALNFYDNHALTLTPGK